MIRPIKIIILLVFLFFGTSALLQAKENRYAVVIGIGKYEDNQIRRLKYTRADAKAVYDFLVDRDGGNFLKDNVRLLLDEEATQVNIRSSLGTFLSRSALRDDTVFIYYAGHGAFEVDRTKQEPDGYAKYIVPYNANSKDLFATAIPMNEIETIFRMIDSERLIFVADACYSGASGGRGFSLAPGGRDLKISPDFIDSLSQGKGRVIITASDANEVSVELDELGHGIFTYYFLEGLKGKADANRDKTITIRETYDYLYEEVVRHSRRAGGNQHPVWKGSVRGTVVLASLSPGKRIASIKAQLEAEKEKIEEEKKRLREERERLEEEQRLAEEKRHLEEERKKLAEEQKRLEELKKKVKPEETKVAMGIYSEGKYKDMILIPAGEFLMGIPAGEGEGNEHPQHRVYLHAFYIDKYEVTNAQFERFVNETGYKTDAEKEGWGWVYSGGTEWKKVSGANWRHPFGPGSDLGGKRSHPVVQVNWNDANAYCQWAGKRLPTEAEWEKAARGTDGRKYPWGNDFACKKGNFDDETKYDSYIVPGGDGCDGYVETAPVGNFPSGASPYGVLDMAGNAWEWVADWYGEDYYRSSPYRNPKGPDKGESRVLRGGSWLNGANYIRAAYRYRYWPDYGYITLGCRCAQD